jgi:hypothetical protein
MPEEEPRERRDRGDRGDRRGGGHGRDKHHGDRKPRSEKVEDED